MKHFAYIILALCAPFSALAQRTEAGGASGFAPGAHASRTLSPEWAASNRVRQASAYEDYDNDLLENWAEEALGTSPWTNDLTSANASAAAALGALDLVPARWKDAHGLVLSAAIGYLDPDGDGWDNWSEWLAGTDPRDAASRPNPTLRIVVDAPHDCPGPLVVWASSSPDANGWPDAVYVRSGSIPAGSSAVELTDADLAYGHLRQGRNWMFAWSNDDGSSAAGLPSWSAPEPAAVCDDQLGDLYAGYDIGFDRNELRFALRDKPISYARLSWEEDGKSHIVHVNDSLNNTVFEMTVEPPRTWIHEGDIIRYALRRGQTSNFGLGAQAGRQGGGTSPNLLKWYVDNVQMGVISNYYSATLPTPQAIYPVGDALYEVRPLFQFSLAPEATEFLFELRRGSSSGTVVYSGRHLAPGRHRSASDSSAFDLCKWRFPYFAGDTMPNGSVLLATNEYYWTVTAYSPADRTGKKSSAAGFPLQAAPAPFDMGLAIVDLRCPGGDTTARAEAFRSRSFNGPPDSALQIGAPGVCALAGLEPGTPYFIRAYVVQGDDVGTPGQTPTAVGHLGGRRPVPAYADNTSTNAIIIRSFQ